MILTGPALWKKSPTGDDSGGIVLGWLIKLSLALTAVGILLFDLVAIGYNHTAVVDDARAVARAASGAVLAQQPDQMVILRAQEAAAERGADLNLEEMRIGSRGAVKVSVTREAQTFVLHYLPVLSDYLVASSEYRVEPL